MLANITFKAYNSDKKEPDSLITEFTLDFIDIDSIDDITEAIQKAYQYSSVLSWSINIDHEYL